MYHVARTGFRTFVTRTVQIHWNIKKRLLVKYIHHFKEKKEKSDLINGTEPSPVILSQTK